MVSNNSYKNIIIKNKNIILAIKLKYIIRRMAIN